MTSGHQLIDVHHHFVPPAYLQAVGGEAIGRTLVSGKAPDWTPAHSIELMDRTGIATAVTSLSAPGLAVPDAARRRSLCRHCNEFAARMRSDHPGRFGSFATLPLPDVDASLAEATHALDVLKAQGICLLTHYDGIYVGDASYWPLYEELDRRRATVFVHPAEPCMQCLPGVPAATLEFPFDTTRAITSLLFSGAFARFRNIAFIFAHAGGTIPFLAGRIARMERRPDIKAAVPDGVVATLGRLHYDVALSTQPETMTLLRHLAGAERILFGSDYPYAPAETTVATVQALPTCGFSAEELAQVGRLNALRIIPSLRDVAAGV